MKAVDDDLFRRAGLHAALGEPVRLAVVDALIVSDRSPKELADHLELPTNLLAHHLDVLQAAGIVERCASTGDRRRRYVRLVPRPLDELAIRSPCRPDRRVVFVCSQNSARSQLAAALWSARTGADASSAGTHPARRVHPGAMAAARRAGLDLSGATPTGLDPSALDDFVVTVCDRAHEELDVQPSWWHWSIPDPVRAATADAFDATVSELDERISAFDT